MRLQLYEVSHDGQNRPVPAGVVAVEQLEGWLPVDALVYGGEPYIKWMDMDGVTLSEPFFHQTVERVRHTRPERFEILTDINALIQFEKICDGLRPTGFIFHGSRCGSTVVSNACGALAEALVLSEPFVVDKLIGQFFTRAGAEGLRERLWQTFLRGAVTALGQRRSGVERHFFIKFACCSVLQLQRLKRLWPEVPWLFVYRDPVEIMVSNLDNRPDWMRYEGQEEHAAALIGVAPVEFSQISAEEFCARALGRFFDAAAAGLCDARARLLAYEEISLARLVEVVRFFGAEPTAAEFREIERVSRVYAKDSARRRPFSDDTERKQQSATPLILEMSERWARAPYERLRKTQREAVRL